jgi:transcriptional regulator with PAS, ATPase and Fis domain
MKFVDETRFALTVCDEHGVIVYMNQKSRMTFSSNEEESLIGKSLLDCHPEPARSKLIDMMMTHESNSYTIEKNGIKKLIHQTPWFEDGEFKGYVELSIEVPFEMPHFVRKPKE